MNAEKEMFDWKAERFRKAERSFELGQISETELAHHGYDFAYEEYHCLRMHAVCLTCRTWTTLVSLEKNQCNESIV